MRPDQLIRDPVFQLNLLLWMAKEQPPQGYVVKPLFFENGFGVIYIEQPFAFPQESILAIRGSGRDVSIAPEPELLLGRMTDKVALYLEAKADSFSTSSTKNCKQARGHLLAVGAAFAEVMTPYRSCLLCYVVPEDRRTLMQECLEELVADLCGCGLNAGSHSSHGLGVLGQELHYTWDEKFRTHTGITETSAVVMSPITDDTDPSPLFLIYTDEDYPDPENRNLLRRCVVNQVHAHLVSDLHHQRFDQTYERSAESLLNDMTEGLYQYLGRTRQKAMRRLVTENFFRRIAEYSRDRFPGVRVEGNLLKVTFADEQAKASFLDWLEDFRRTAFQAERPPEEPASLFDGLNEAAEGEGDN
jgi:hypothetical protein